MISTIRSLRFNDVYAIHKQYVHCTYRIALINKMKSIISITELFIAFPHFNHDIFNIDQQIFYDDFRLEVYARITTVHADHESFRGKLILRSDSPRFCVYSPIYKTGRIGESAIISQLPPMDNLADRTSHNPRISHLSNTRDYTLHFSVFLALMIARFVVIEESETVVVRPLSLTTPFLSLDARQTIDDHFTLQSPR